MEDRVLRGASVSRTGDGPCLPVPLLDQGLRDAVRSLVAGRPAVRRRSTRYAKEDVCLCARVGRSDDRPRSSVPALDQRLNRTAKGVAVYVVADCPALRLGHARHREKVIVLDRKGVGRGDEGPRISVPALHQRLIVAGETIFVEANGPAVQRRRAGYTIELVVLGSVGTWRVDDCPGDSVPALDECLIDAARVVAPDGPALRGRYTRHAVEKVVSCGAGIGRTDDGP